MTKREKKIIDKCDEILSAAEVAYQSDQKSRILAAAIAASIRERTQLRYQIDLNS